MRIAVMADIHGNLPAFEAALKHSRNLSLDLLVLAGDVINGAPDSRGCWDLAKSLNCPIIRGNHERYVGMFGRENAPPEWSTDRFAPVRWSAGQFSDVERQSLLDLPLEWTSLTLPDIYFCHSSKKGDSDLVAAYSTEAEIDRIFEPINAPLILRGHNHAPAIRPWKKSTIVTAGSVGLTLDGVPSAQYVVLTGDPGAWRIEHQSVEYDIDAALDRFKTSGYLEYAGPMAKLFYREVATASFQIVPFMRMYTLWLKQEPLSLDEALERYLNAGCGFCL